MGKKLNNLDRLKKTKKSIRFEDLTSLLKHSGFIEQSTNGSHHIFGKKGCLPIMIVKPHGGKKYCHPMDVNKVIKILEAIK